MRGTGGALLSRGRVARGGGGMESGRARTSTDASESTTRNAGGRGDERVMMSLISCAIQSTSSETLSSMMETMELLRTGSPILGVGCTNRTDACWDLKVGARIRCERIGDSSSEVGGVEQGVLGLDVQSLLATEGLGDGSRLRAREAKVAADDGGEGKSSEIPRPEKRRLISSRDDSDVDEGAADLGGVLGRERGEGERTRGGGEGVRVRGALDGGKKSSKVRPSTPVKTTLRESRLSCVGRAPMVALLFTYREGWKLVFVGRECDDEQEVRLGLSSSSATLGRMWRTFEFDLAGDASDLFEERPRRLRLGRILLEANTRSGVSWKPGMADDAWNSRDAIVEVVRI